MNGPKTIKNGRMIIHPNVAPLPPPLPVSTSHISEPVRAALSKHTPEVAQRVRDVADTK